MTEPHRATATEDKPAATPPRLLERLSRWFKTNGDAETVRDVIEELIEERIEDGPGGDGNLIDSHERLLLANVLRLRDVSAADIMVPRADIIAVEAETPLIDVLRVLVKEGHSRVPVYRETLDDVIGMVHIKDLAILIADQAGDAGGKGADAAGTVLKLTDVIRKVLFVSPAARVLDLLLDMRLKRTHMATVVDEYGGIDGLITIEDVVEQIVGEIEDEHDTDDEPRLIGRDDGSFVADARVKLEEFETRFGQLFSNDEREQNDTLGGLVISLAGRVPGRSELIKHPSGIEFEILDSDPRRVRRLRIRNIPSQPTEHD
ncbi:MAG: HlyC/CorC family transporter [Rhodospirillaceae bacterium]|nr:MAG: HlyC/CorC family transporter [Rhodospirillaceae bacterium]